MTHCTRCGRRLKAPTATGLGPVCQAKAMDRDEQTADLWFDTEQLAQRARQRVNFRIEISYKRALRDVRQDFAAARGRLGL